MKKEIYYRHDTEIICVIKTRFCKFRGKAKYNPTDTWNEEKGRRIAFLRANDKYLSYKICNLNRGSWFILEKLRMLQRKGKKLINTRSKVSVELDNSRADLLKILHE